MAVSRRDFLKDSSSCAAHMALAGLLVPRARWMNWLRDPLGQVVAQEKFARLEKVAEGVWALISDPFSGDRTTLANGGIIAGKNGVVAIEGFFMPKGATWLAETGQGAHRQVADPRRPHALPRRSREWTRGVWRGGPAAAIPQHSRHPGPGDHPQSAR
jgi:hypothetical protein